MSSIRDTHISWPSITTYNVLCSMSSVRDTHISWPIITTYNVLHSMSSIRDTYMPWPSITFFDVLCFVSSFRDIHMPLHSLRTYTVVCLSLVSEPLRCCCTALQPAAGDRARCQSPKSHFLPEKLQQLDQEYADRWAANRTCKLIDICQSV